MQLWCLGNELDGPWQTGHKTAHEYGRLAAETARALRQAEPGLELVACGSSNSSMPTFGEWEATVLELAYDQVDHISCHAYYEVLDGDVDSFLASAVDMDHFIESVVATADAIGARLGSSKRITLSFDEWNVWYQRRFNAEPARRLGGRAAAHRGHLRRRRRRRRRQPADLAAAPQRPRGRRPARPSWSNVIAPIRTEPGGPAWRQTIFHPFALTSRLARGQVLRVDIGSPTYPTARFGDVPVVDAVATHDPETGDTVLFAVNRSSTEPVELSMPLADLGAVTVAEAWTITEADPTTTNTREFPDRVRPRAQSTTVADGTLRVVLPPVSWVAVRLAH